MKIHPSYDTAYREHAKHVWAIVYRMTGSAQDADDVVQDAFVRAMVRDPSATSGQREVEARAPQATDLRPWLTRIAINAGIDLLRQRRRSAYIGPWLPEPFDTEDESSTPPEPGADCRYDLLESASFAFLVALEALAPRARAVLLLRDVFDYSVREVAETLAMSETHVKVTHHRARRIMATYEADRCVPTRELQERTRSVLATLMAHLAAQDVAGIERILADGVRTLSDSAGEHLAARVPVVGRKKVATFWAKASAGKIASEMDVRMLNGLPAVMLTFALPAGYSGRSAPRSVITMRLDAQGLVREIHTILASRKLLRLFGGPAPDGAGVARAEPELSKA
ncbi:sigma-70 family RNA polymerase sigma factor [Pendulispora albinea]|uniref:Sigma-70 family RNA polymerase sigma factor n=1 Tax=Pendulispora albinea TaxID=2741071 RepID=A0ABZ2LM65_9BACT